MKILEESYLIKIVSSPVPHTKEKRIKTVPCICGALNTLAL
jgi:hypothetical protein